MRLQAIRERCHLESYLQRRMLCEFVATTFLIYVGLSIDAQMHLSRQQMNSHLAHSLGWGLTLTLAVQCAFRCSGAHLNPAVSFFMWSLGAMRPFKHVLCYAAAQTLGAFLGAALLFSLYFDKINEFDGGIRSVDGANSTAQLFATYPNSHLSILGSIIDQISSTAVMCFSIGIITDPRNEIPTPAQPPLMGVMLSMICLGFGLNAGNAMNPARDFGPRLFSLLAGYGWEVISYKNYSWFWIPILCPFVGALLGSWAYQSLIGAQLDDPPNIKNEVLKKISTTSTTQNPYKTSSDSLESQNNDNNNSQETKRRPDQKISTLSSSTVFC